MKCLTFVITMLACMFLFSGCGQSGALYVADRPSQMAVPPSRDTAREEQQDEQEEESDESSETE